MKTYTIREIIQSEKAELIRNQKTALLKTVLLLLIGFGSVMLVVNARQGNLNTCRGIGVLLAIMIGETLAVLWLHNATYVFAIGKSLILTAFFVYLLLGQDRGGDAIWFWFLAAPPFGVYIAGLFWGFWEILYGQLLLILLLWSPLSRQVITPTTAYLTRLPAIYLVVSVTCLAISWSLTKYQIEQQKAAREIGAQLTEATERRRIDRMTGLLNRDRAEELIAEQLSTGGRGAFFLMDIDNFKMMNDLKGHLAGDQMLADFAEQLRAVFPPSALLSRFGGDEFVAFLPDYESQPMLGSLAESLLERAAHLTNDASLSDKIGVSIGIALSPADGSEFHTLYSNADKGQYFAKRSGKQRYSFYANSYVPDCKRVSGADISTLRRMVQSVQQEQGAFYVEYAAFSKVYQFLQRNATRIRQETQILLFSMLDEAGCVPEGARLDAAYAALNHAVRQSLRVGDLMMDFSSSQVSVLLIGCDSENAAVVAQRILMAFCKRFSDGISVSYELDSIHSAPFGASPVGDTRSQER